MRSPRDGVVLVDHDAALVETVNGPGTEDVVAAMSRAAGELSDEIAAALAGQATRSGKRRPEAR